MSDSKRTVATGAGSTETPKAGAIDLEPGSAAAEHLRNHPYTPAFIVAMILGVGLNPVNSTLISTALAPISQGLGIPASQSTLLVSVLYLACAIAQPTAGKLSEQIGPRRVFMAGAWLVIAGGIVGGTASTLGQLIVSRVLIGLGTSCGYPSAMYMVRSRAQEAGLAEPPSAMLSVLAMVGLVLIAVGPPLGGALVAAFGWRAAFVVNLPVGALTIIFGYLSLEKDRKLALEGGISQLMREIDLAGIVLFAIFISLLLCFLLALPTVSPTLALTSVIALVAFCAWELRYRKPFIDISILATNGALTLNFIRAMLTMLGAYVVLYALPQWLEDACGQSPQLAGMAIIPMGIVATVVSLIAARAGSARLQYVLCSISMAVAGALLCLAGQGMLAPAWAASAVAGATLGFSMSVSQLVLYQQSEPEHIGTASGLLRTFIYLGSIGAASLGGIFFSPKVTDAGLHAIGLAVAILGLAALVLAIIDRGLRQHA